MTRTSEFDDKVQTLKAQARTTGKAAVDVFNSHAILVQPLFIRGRDKPNCVLFIDGKRCGLNAARIKVLNDL